MQNPETAAPAPRKRVAWPSARLAAAWALLVALAGLNFSGVALSRFERDESQWVHTARFLSLFARGNFSSPDWNSYWTHTQPPLARYVIGLSLKAGGIGLDTLNGPWDFTKEDDENIRLGNRPSAAMLFWARLPMALVASASVVILFLVGRAIGGTAAGLGAAAWLALNPRSRELMTRAEADGLLICLMLLGLWLSLGLIAEVARAQAKGASWLRPLVLTVATGAVMGLAASSKLTGALGLLALAIALPLDSILRWVNEGRGYGGLGLVRRGLAALSAVVGVGSVALLVFVLLNPFTYPHPFKNTQQLFAYRQEEMAAQMALYPTAALHGPARLGKAVERPLFTYGVGAGLAEAVGGRGAEEIGHALPLDAGLVAVGLGATLARLVRAHLLLARSRGSKLWRHMAASGQRRPALGLGTAGVVLAWTVVHFAAIALNMGLDWDRYVLPISVFAALWAGVGIAWLLERLAGGLRSRSHRSLSQPSAP